MEDPDLTGLDPPSRMQVPALEAASGESGLPGEGLVGSVAAAGGAAAAVAQEAT